MYLTPIIDEPLPVDLVEALRLLVEALRAERPTEELRFDWEALRGRVGLVVPSCVGSLLQRRETAGLTSSETHLGLHTSDLCGLRCGFLLLFPPLLHRFLFRLPVLLLLETLLFLLLLKLLLIQLLSQRSASLLVGLLLRK